VNLTGRRSNPNLDATIRLALVHQDTTSV
jgi:hypothetical protein